MEAKKHKGKWLRLTENPQAISTLYNVRTRITGYRLYSEIDDMDDFTVEIRRLEDEPELGHLYIRYNGKRK